MENMTLKQRFSLLILGFTAAAFGGWCYEEICVYVLYGQIVNRGMLHLTLCPIYGFGAWGLYLLLYRVRNKPLFFLLSTAIASAFEYGCALLLETVFHRRFWSYEGWLLSVHDRISLISSLIFGVLAIFFAGCIVPFLGKRVRSGRENLWFAASLVILAVITGDFLLVLRNY